MIEYLRENWGSILVLAVVLAVVIAILRSMYKQRKAGKSGCGCGCSDCPSNGICHPKQ